MKNVLGLLSIFMIMASCNTNHHLENDFNCSVQIPYDLEEISDFKNKFQIELPKKWKTKLYYDDAVSSIFSADTTKNLTKSIILDISFIDTSIPIDKQFIEKIKGENLKLNLKELKSEVINFNGLQSFYTLTKGKRGKFNYHNFTIFSKVNLGFLQMKTELYGDSLVNQRICTAIKLIEKIRLK